MKPDKVTIHCSDTKNGEYVDIEKIRKWHVEENKWSDIGYHAIFNPSGQVNAGRSLNKMGAGVKGHNSGNIHYCLIGTDRFTMPQFVALRYHLEGLNHLYDINPWDFCCHYEFDSAIEQGKTCPNMRVANIVAWYTTGLIKPIRPYLLKYKF